MPPGAFAVRSSRVVTPEGVHPSAVLIDSGTITAIVDPDRIPEGYEIADEGDLVVMPGLVDTHVHINEPGRTEWEGFETATKAAAAGGVTTLVDMPLNSSPVTTTVAALKQKIASTKGKLTVDCGFYGGLVPGNTGDIEPMINAGVLGIKAFLVHSGIDEFPNATESDLRAAMPVIAHHQIPLLVHCELATNQKSLPRSPRGKPGPKQSFQGIQKSYREYLLSRPGSWEHAAIDLMVRLCGEYSCKVHIVHVSSSETIPLLHRARRAGLHLTTETCPHYLYFTAEGIADGDTRFKCAPPIREKKNRERLWKALSDGDLDFIVSDHSPSPPELKCLSTGDFRKAWGGISSLQFGLSIVWTQARERGFSMTNVAEWMCTRPAGFAGLATKGRIAPGYDADFVVWDPDGSFTVAPSMVHHRHTLTPYEGRVLSGKVKKTYLRGREIYRDDTFVGGPAGKILLSRR